MTRAEEYEVHKVGNSLYQYHKIYDKNGMISYERVVNPEERELINQQAVSYIVKILSTHTPKSKINAK